MKHFLFLALAIALRQEVCGQEFQMENENPRGWVSAISLDVKTNERPIKFSTAADYSAPKVFPSYFQLTVKAPRVARWVITASLAEAYSSSNPGSGKLSNLVQLKANGQTFTISDRPQVIVQSNGNIQQRAFDVDLIITPPFNTSEGIFPGMVNFHLELL